MAEYRIQEVLSFVCRTLVFITRINSVYLFLANITTTLLGISFYWNLTLSHYDCLELKAVYCTCSRTCFLHVNNRVLPLPLFLYYKSCDPWVVISFFILTILSVLHLQIEIPAPFTRITKECLRLIPVSIISNNFLIL